MEIYYTSYTEYKPMINICTICRKILKKDFEYCPYCEKKSLWIRSSNKVINFLFSEDEVNIESLFDDDDDDEDLNITHKLY